MHYPADPVAMEIGTEFLVGDQLLVVPALGPKVTEVDVYLQATALSFFPPYDQNCAR